MKIKDISDLHYDQSGRAYPDNPERKKNWERIWRYDGKFYRIVGLPSHAEWDEIELPYCTKIKIKDIEDYHIRRWNNGLETGHSMDEIRDDIRIAAHVKKKYKNIFGKEKQ